MLIAANPVSKHLELAVRSIEKQIGISKRSLSTLRFLISSIAIVMHAVPNMDETTLAVLSRDVELGNYHTSVSSNDSLPKAVENADAPGRMRTVEERSNLVAEKENEVMDNNPVEQQWALDGFNFKTVLGQGNAAKVMLAESKATKELYAIKIQRKDLLVENDEVSSPTTEKSILVRATSSDHPFIAKLYATFQTETRLYFVLEYISGGDLLFRLQNEDFGPKRTQYVDPRI